MGINELAWEGEKVKLCLPGPDKSSDIYYHSLCAGDFSSGEKGFLSEQMCVIFIQKLTGILSIKMNISP